MQSSKSDAPSVRVAFEGCGHGCLHDIYASVERAASLKGWDGVDLVIIGGDFQAVRNSHDMACMAVPPKFKQIGDFHEYYSGKRTAPYLTIFIGGNHEASNHLFELYYGGWVAPNIYYMGAANVLRFGPLRIAGMSGIWKGYDYRKPHFERLPYNDETLRSIFHVREIDARKLLQISTQVDVGLSHDWPRRIEYSGDHEKLFRIKRGFREDSERGVFGSVAARLVLDRLRPAYWFSAHYHVKFGASVQHEKYPYQTRPPHVSQSSSPQPTKIPYMFGMDGAAFSLFGEEQGTMREDDQTLPAHPAATNTGTTSSYTTADVKPSEHESQMGSDTGNPAVLPTHPAEQGHGILNQQETGDIQNRLSAWNHFHNVAATNEAAENSRFLAEENKEAREIQHNLTWRQVDIDEDGSRRRLHRKDEEAASNKKQKVHHDVNPVKNDDEIPLDIDSDQETSQTPEKDPAPAHANTEGNVSEDLRNQLPASFARPEPSSQPTRAAPIHGPPEAITNTTTQFLSLDKCGPRREFLQLMELYPVSEQDASQPQRPYCLQYDKEWLAISRAFANELHLGDPTARVPEDKGDAVYKPQIIEAENWIEENVVKPGKLNVPENFSPTAPFFDPTIPVTTQQFPPEYNSPQTAQFCELIGIENKFYLTDEERQARAQAAPPQRSHHARQTFGRGRGRGRGRGYSNQGRIM